MFKVGDKVRVKSIESIRRTLDENSEHHITHIRFASGMEEHVGEVFTIDSLIPEEDKEYSVFGNIWYWHEDWVDHAFQPIILDESLFNL